MKLKEALSEYYPTSTNPLVSHVQSIQLSRQLKIDIAEWGKADPAMGVTTVTVSDVLLGPVTAVRGVSNSGEIKIEVVL